jgi:hypothetical protein
MMAGAGGGQLAQVRRGPGGWVTFYNIVEPEHPISFLGVY